MKFHEDVPTLGSMLLSSADPERLERWYSEFSSLGQLPIMFDKRDEITGPTKEPTRYILNFHCNDAKKAVAKLDAMGVEWISPLEERGEGIFFATTVDPDGNYVQLIQSSDDMYIEYIKPAAPFPGYSVNSIEDVRSFYKDVLGLKVIDYPMGNICLAFTGGSDVMIYPKGDDHQPATYTVLNFPVPSVEEEVDRLVKLGVTFEQYEGIDQDQKGIASTGNGSIAWFKDPAGNILAILEV